MAGCGATGEQHIVLGKRIFYSASFSSGCGNVWVTIGSVK